MPEVAEIYERDLRRGYFVTAAGDHLREDHVALEHERLQDGHFLWPAGDRCLELSLGLAVVRLAYRASEIARATRFVLSILLDASIAQGGEITDDALDVVLAERSTELRTKGYGA